MFIVTWSSTAQALAMFQEFKRKVVLFARTAEAYFGGTGAADAVESVLNKVEGPHVVAVARPACRWQSDRHRRGGSSSRPVTRPRSSGPYSGWARANAIWATR